ncbi:MAG: hypothetical protein QOG42_2098, partial [Solirubrobacteraceae bacterium]|nr:hypothetical protein [Solirubrobacteraceae bacterium]
MIQRMIPESSPNVSQASYECDFVKLVSLDPDDLSKGLWSILFRLVRPLRGSRKTPVFCQTAVPSFVRHSSRVQFVSIWHFRTVRPHGRHGHNGVLGRYPQILKSANDLSKGRWRSLSGRGLDLLRRVVLGVLLKWPKTAGGRPIDAILLPSVSLRDFEQFAQWLFGDVLGWANIIQIPALLLTAWIAWLLCRPIRAWLTASLNRVQESTHLDWLQHHRPWVIDRLIPLVTPIAWVTGLWMSVSIAEHVGWPHAVAEIAINLVLAWLVIRLAADVVPNAALAQLIAVLAWVVAALNIVHLLGPTLDLLDRAAILVGGLRISLLTVVKGVLSLTVLLWAATVVSALFERRMTRVSEITPRARVLLGKLLKTTLV